MYQYLYKYFALHKKLAIPGIGTFAVENENPGIDFAEKLIYPSKQHIIYKADNTVPERKLFNFLAAHLQTDEVNAIRKFNDYAVDLKEELNANGTVILPGIGKLMMQIYNSYTFKEEERISFFTSLPAERVIRKNAEHFIRVGEEERTSTEMQEQLNHEHVKKDIWWLYALVLGIIGFAAIAYNYFAGQ